MYVDRGDKRSQQYYASGTGGLCERVHTVLGGLGQSSSSERPSPTCQVEDNKIPSTLTLPQLPCNLKCTLLHLLRSGGRGNGKNSEK